MFGGDRIATEDRACVYHDDECVELAGETFCWGADEIDVLSRGAVLTSHDTNFDGTFDKVCFTTHEAYTNCEYSWAYGSPGVSEKGVIDKLMKGLADFVGIESWAEDDAIVKASLQEGGVAEFCNNEYTALQQACWNDGEECSRGVP